MEKKNENSFSILNHSQFFILPYPPVGVVRIGAAAGLTMPTKWRYYGFMSGRTTIEIDKELLARAQAALGETTPSATVETALRRVADSDSVNRAANQRYYLRQLAERVDISILASEEMWR